MREREPGSELTMRKSDGVRIHHDKRSEGVRGDHEKKSNRVRVHHEKERWGDSSP
mgnify:CR=1 FL=1